jgi:hypothetical protein
VELQLVFRDDTRKVRYEFRTSFSPSCATLVVDHEGGIGFWDTTSGALRRFVEASMHLGSFAGGRRVLVRQGDAVVALDTEDGSEVWRARVPHVECESLERADDVILLDQRFAGAVVALGADDGIVRHRYAGRVGFVDRDVFVLQTADVSSLRVAATGAELVTLPVRAEAVAVSPDRRWLAAYRSDIELWDLGTRTLHRTLPGASSFRFREDSAALVTYESQTQQSGNQDWNIERVFDVVTGACIDEQSWWDQDRPPAPPAHIPPELVAQVHWRAIIGRSPRGEVFVALTDKNGIELSSLR